MARIAVLDDLKADAELVAAPLVLARHTVLIDLAPSDFERIASFGPQVIVLAMRRARAAFDRPIESPDRDIIGYTALRQLEDYPALLILPVMIVAVGLLEQHIPKTLNYDLFLTLPDDYALIAPKADDLATKVKSRRRLTDYHCPSCDARLTTSDPKNLDFFCPRCGTAVATIGDQALVLERGAPGQRIIDTRILRRTDEPGSPPDP